MPSFELTYEDYLNNRPDRYDWEAGAETAPNLTEEQWSAQSPEDRWRLAGGRLVLTPDDPRYDELNAVARAETGRNIWVEMGDPNYRPDWINDPDRIVRGEGWHAVSQDNFSPDWSREQETQTRRMRQRGTIAAAALVAGGLAYGALAGGAGATGGAAAGATGGAAAGATGGAAAGATGGAAAGATGGAAAPSFAGVIGGSSTTAGTQGIIGSAWDAVPGWYNGLSPAGRMVVNQAISSGAQALSSASAQRAAQQAADEREERTRQDRIRRGAVPAVVNPYTPRPAGIIGSALTPRPGGG